MQTTCSRAAAMALSALLSLAVPIRSAASPSAFGAREAWLDPRAVHVADSDLAFTDEPAPHLRNEAFYVTGRLDSGWVFTAGFFGWRLGPLRGYGAYALIGRPDGSHIWKLRQLKREEISVEQGRFAVRAEGIRFSGEGGRYDVSFRKDDLSLELELDGILPAWRPGDGLARWSDDENAFTRLAMPLPWATVTGSLTVEGRTNQVRGQAYSDCTLTVLPPNRLPAETACFRVWSSPGTPASDRWFVSVIEYVSHPALGSLRVPVLLVAHGSDWVLTTPVVTVERRSPAESSLGPYPTRYVVRAEDQGYLISGEYRAETLYETTDMLGEVPPVFRGIVALFTQRSINYRSIGTFRGTLTEPGGRTHALELSGPGEYLVVR